MQEKPCVGAAYSGGGDWCYAHGRPIWECQEPETPEEGLLRIFEEALAKMTPEQADAAIEKIMAIPVRRPFVNLAGIAPDFTDGKPSSEWLRERWQGDHRTLEAPVAPMDFDEIGSGIAGEPRVDSVEPPASQPEKTRDDLYYEAAMLRKWLNTKRVPTANEHGMMLSLLGRVEAAIAQAGVAVRDEALTSLKPWLKCDIGCDSVIEDDGVCSCGLEAACRALKEGK